MLITEYIKKEGNVWVVYSETGKVLGTYDTKKEAEERLKQIEMFKHMKESNMNKFYKFLLENFGVKITEQIDTEDGIEKVIRALLVDQYGLDKSSAGKLVKAGFNKEKIIEVMDEIELADKLKADYLKLVNLWKSDVDVQAHSDLEYLMKEAKHHVEIIESKSKDGSVWEVVVIEKGKSHNNTVYGDKALEDIKNIINESDSKGEPIKCNAFKFENMLNHLNDAGRKFIKGFTENIAGWFRNAKIKGKKLIAELHLDEGSKKIMSLLKTAHKKGIKKPFGLSIDGDGNVIDKMIGGKPVLEVAGVNSLNSIDCVTFPSAGGKFLSIIESICKENEMFKKLLERLGKIHPSLIEGIDLEKVDLETAKRIMKEASEKDARFSVELTEENVGDVLDTVIDIQIAEASKKDEPAKVEPKPAKVEPKPDPAVGDALEEADATLKELRELKEEAKKEKCALLIDRLLEQSELPSSFKNNIREEFEGRIFEETELKNRISALEKSVADFKEETGTPTRVNVQVTERDKKLSEIQESFDALFGIEDENGNLKKGKFRGIYDAYVAVTGDPDVNFDSLKPYERRSRLHESIVTADFPELLKDSANKVLVREYNVGEAMYRKLANVVPLRDFKTQQRPSMGEFSNLATVAEDDEYQEFTNPSEENAQYAPLTKGNIIGISRRAILNDDLGAFKKLTKMMGKSALRTINQFAFDGVMNYDTAINDGVIYDGNALYDAVNHSNTTTDPLGYTSLDNALTAMWLHKDMDDQLEYGIEPKYLIIPRQLKSTAIRILKTEKLPGEAPAYEDVNPVYDACEIMVSPYLRGDANNWYLLADPQRWDGMEIGFVQGKETPMLVTANNESVGTMFTRDRIQYKIRHEYGKGTLDYRPFYGGIVA